MNHPRVVIAGTHSGVGKTLIASGIMCALKKKGMDVHAFKAGPDYIDPSYHAQILRRPSCNLDTWLLSRDAILELFERRSRDADISIVEGVMGLYDGLSTQEEGSTAHLAKTLKAPVILIIDARSISSSAGAVALGFKEFDRRCKICGIILNNVGSPSHYKSASRAIEKKTNIPVIGHLPREPNLTLPQRHLGLIPTQEKILTERFIENLAKSVQNNIDLDGVLKIASSAGGLPHFKMSLFEGGPPPNEVRIAIAYDNAFNFYYADNLDLLKHYGARLSKFSPIAATRLPEDSDGLYIGGGFPELYASRLAGNSKLKEDIRKKAASGMPLYAECGGLMYLVRRLVDFKGRSHPMVGLFGGEVCMDKKLNRLGYVSTETLEDNILSQKGRRNRAHVFHWSYLKSKDNGYAYRIKKGDGSLSYDGLIRDNVLASYAHLHFGSDVSFAKNFIDRCREYKKNR